MSYRRVEIRLWSGQDLDASGTLTSPVIDVSLFTDMTLLLRASHATATADVKAEYAVSPDGTALGDFNAEADLVASTAALSAPENWHEARIASGAKWLAVRITELSGLNNNNVVDAILIGQEQLR